MPNSFEILLKMVADLEGGKDVKAVLAEVKEATKQVIPENAKLSESTDEASKKFKLFEGHGKEVNKVIQELTRDFPLAGQALRFFTNPIGVVLTGAILVFRAFKKDIEETNKVLDELGRRGAESIGNMQASLNEAREATHKAREEFETWRKSISDTSAKGVEAMDQEIKKLHELDDAYLKSIEIQMAAQRQKIEIEEKDPATKAAKLAAVDAAEQEIKNAANRNTAAQEKALLEKQLETEKKKLADAAGQVAKTQSAAEDVAKVASQTDREKILMQAKSDLELAQRERGTPEAAEKAEKLEKFHTELEHVKRMIAFSERQGIAHSVEDGKLKKLLAEQGAIESVNESPEQKMLKAQSIISKIQSQIEAEKNIDQEAADARKRYEAQKKRVDDLETKKSDTDRKLDIEEQHRKEKEKASVVTQYGVLKDIMGGAMMDPDTYARGYNPVLKSRMHQNLSPLERQAANDFISQKATMESAGDRIIKEGFSAAQAEAHGQKLNESQKQQLEAFKTLMQTIDGHGQKHVELARKTTNVVKSQQDEIQYLHGQLMALERLVNNINHRQ